MFMHNITLVDKTCNEAEMNFVASVSLLNPSILRHALPIVHTATVRTAADAHREPV